MSDPKRCYCCDIETSKTWRKSKRWAEGEPLCNGCGTAEIRGKTMKEVRAKRASAELEPTPVPKSAVDDSDIDIGTGSPEQLDIKKEIEKTLPPPLVLTPDAPKKRGRPKKEVTVGLEEKDPLAPAPKAKKEKAVKAPKEPKPEKVKAVKEPKVAKPPKPEKAPKPPKQPKVKIPKEPKAKKERTKPVDRKRVVRTADNLPKFKECPKCKASGPLEETFGTRLMNEKIVPQSQCRKCRREAAAKTNQKKKVGNEKFNKAKESDKAIQEKKVVSKPLNRGTKATEEAAEPAVKVVKKKAGPKVTMPETPAAT